MTLLPLARRRELGELLGDSFRLYARNFAAFLGIAAAIVVPVDVIVLGVGLNQLSAPYEGDPTLAETLVPTGVGFLITAPLITATCAFALLRLARGDSPRLGRSLTDGLEAFTPLFAAVVLAALGIVAGLLLLVLPGIYLAIRWYFVPQAVALARRRGPGALRESWDAVEGSWWRTFGVVLLANLMAALPALVLLPPSAALARSADRELWTLVGQIVVESLTTPFVALVSILLWYDLLARRGQP